MADLIRQGDASLPGAWGRDNVVESICDCVFFRWRQTGRGKRARQRFYLPVGRDFGEGTQHTYSGREDGLLCELLLRWQDSGSDLLGRESEGVRNPPLASRDRQGIVR